MVRLNILYCKILIFELILTKKALLIRQDNNCIELPTFQALLNLIVIVPQHHLFVKISLLIVSSDLYLFAIRFLLFALVFYEILR